MSAQRTGSPDEIAPLAGSDPFPGLQLSKAPLAAQYFSALAMTAAAALVAVAVDSQVTIPNLSLVFVIPVIVAAVAFGLGSSLFAAVLGALAYNFFLTEPRYTLVVDDPANIWAIGLLFVVGCIASAVASTARRRADDAAHARRQVVDLRSYSRNVLAANDARALAASAATTLEALFGVPAVVILMSGAEAEIVEKRGGIELLEAEIEAARSSLASGTVRAGVYPFDTSRFDFWPVATSAGPQVVIGLAFDPQERPPLPGTLVETVAGMLALALERQQLRLGMGAQPGI